LNGRTGSRGRRRALRLGGGTVWEGEKTVCITKAKQPARWTAEIGPCFLGPGKGEGGEKLSEGRRNAVRPPWGGQTNGNGLVPKKAGGKDRGGKKGRKGRFWTTRGGERLGKLA